MNIYDCIKLWGFFVNLTDLLQNCDSCWWFGWGRFYSWILLIFIPRELWVKQTGHGDTKAEDCLTRPISLVEVEMKWSTLLSVSIRLLVFVFPFCSFLLQPLCFGLWNYIDVNIDLWGHKTDLTLKHRKGEEGDTLEQMFWGCQRNSITTFKATWKFSRD